MGQCRLRPHVPSAGGTAQPRFSGNGQLVRRQLIGRSEVGGSSGVRGGRGGGGMRGVESKCICAPERAQEASLSASCAFPRTLLCADCFATCVAHTAGECARSGRMERAVCADAHVAARPCCAALRRPRAVPHPSVCSSAPLLRRSLAHQVRAKPRTRCGGR